MAQPINEITIRFIPHAAQRYPTAGDWRHEDDRLAIYISRTENPLHEQLVAIHELSEALLCNNDGVTQEAVDAFDMGPGKDLDDPGNTTAAPYHGQHMTATAIERVMASAMRVDWAEYDAALMALE
jgi:hypothetical protein